MKIDYFSCTKMLYFGEKLLRDGYYTLPDINTDFAKQFDMTVKEIQDIQKQFEHDKLLVWEDVSTEIEDEYGNMRMEISSDALTVNKKKIEEFIKYLKKRYYLRENPFISREALVSIVKQIKNVFDKNVLIRVINAFSPNTVAWLVIGGKYTLIDLLWRCAYIKTRTKPIKAEGQPLSFVFAEFLNPIYYSIQNKKIAYQLFEYIDGIILTHASKKDYLDWIKEAKKHIIIKKRTQKLKQKTSQKRIDYKTLFDKNKSILIIENKEIKIRKFSNQYYLLEIIFKDEESKEKDWQFSEIAETIECLEGFSDKKLYNIVNAIKHKIAEETGIKDFFITTTQSIKINEKYLKKS